jgi:molecular chaperone DnaK
MNNQIICGIDLGTTNSVIAHLKDGVPAALSVDEGSAILPSIVSLDETTGEVLVGRRARNRLLAFPDATIRSIKRLMGKDTAVQLGSRRSTPEEVSSLILGHLTAKASEVLGTRVSSVVISVPAYFDDAQRRATIRAGDMAGLEVLRIVNEPTAAALVYDHAEIRDSGQSPYIMVYDLGGGTFDVSILEIKGAIREVLASCGDTALGGDDFDDRLKEMFLRRLKEETGRDLSGDRSLQVRLRDIAERAKIVLSDNPYVRVREVALAAVDGKPANLDLEVSRADFEDMTHDLMERTIRKVEEALREAHLKAGDIGRVLLVGGATRMAAVQTAIAEMFEQPIAHSVDPDLCVALGAAVQGGLIAGVPLGHILLDVSAHSLGVKTLDAIHPETGEADYFSVIIRRNSRVPVSRSEVYYTLSDDQEMVKVEVYQGESPSCAANTRVGSFDFVLKPAPIGCPVTVRFAYDREGIVHVTVDQKSYDNTETVTLDVRKKEFLKGVSETLEGGPINYISEKARRLLGQPGLPRELLDRLTAATARYESALREEAEDAAIEAAEDELLELIESLEEKIEQDGQEAEKG